MCGEFFKKPKTRPQPAVILVVISNELVRNLQVHISTTPTTYKFPPFDSKLLHKITPINTH